MAVNADRMPNASAPALRQRLGIAPDAFVILAYGGVTPEKRIRAAVRAIAATGHHHPDLRLLIVGAGVASDALAEARAAGIADCIAVTGYVADEDLPACLAAADAALCLRWPTARETSAAWVDCIAAGLPTVVTDLVHLAHIPTLEPLHWTVRHIDTHGQRVTPVAISVDMSDEVGLLARALRRLIEDAALRARLGDAARRHFERHHTIAQMAGDYLRVIDLAAATPPPEVTLPAHLRPDCWRLASSVGGSVGVDVRSAITGGSGGLPAVRADAGHAALRRRRDQCVLSARTVPRRPSRRRGNPEVRQCLTRSNAAAGVSIGGRLQRECSQRWSLRVERRLRGRDAAVDFGKGVGDLGAPRFVRRVLELTGHLGVGELQRLDLAHLFRVLDCGPPRLRAAQLQFFHAFLYLRIRVDQSFACVSHVCQSPVRISVFNGVP